MKRKSIAVSALMIALALPTGALAQQTTPWVNRTIEDVMTDTARHIAVTEGNGMFAMFACDGAELSLFGVKVHYLDIEFGDHRPVTWRVDSEEPVRGTWINNSDGGAYIQGPEAISMARAVANAQERFAVRSGNETVSYSVRGSTATIGEAFERCGIAMEAGSAASAASGLADAMRQNP